MTDQEDRPEETGEGTDPQQRLTKDELNLAEFPFALSCHRAPKDTKSIQISEKGLVKEGRPIQREWTVKASGEGLPLAIDEEIFLGLMHFFHRGEVHDRRVYFTQHSLFKLLGWSGNQRDYERLELSLSRLRGSTIECKESFWDHKGKAYLTTGFSLIDSYSLYRRDDASFDVPFISSITLSETIFESFKAGFIKTLDLNVYLALKSPIARKLFRYLDKKLYKGYQVEVDLMRLASRLALTDSAYPSIVKKHLDRGAHPELQAIGLIKNVRYIRKGTAPAVQYQLAPRTHWRLPRADLPAAPKPQNPLLAELVSRGISHHVAKSLLAAHGEKKIADKLEVFDHLRSENSSLISKNSAGFLRQSIEKDFAPPSGYVPRAERQRRKEQEAELRRQELELTTASARADKERQERFERMWAGLTPAEQEDLEEQVLATMSQFARKAHVKEKLSGRVGPGHHTLRAGLMQLLEKTRGLDLPPAPLRSLV
jgi:hypothetical protein